MTSRSPDIWAAEYIREPYTYPLWEPADELCPKCRQMPFEQFRLSSRAEILLLGFDEQDIFDFNATEETAQHITTFVAGPQGVIRAEQPSGEPGAAPNGGPAATVDNPNASGGPPSVS